MFNRNSFKNSQNPLPSLFEALLAFILLTLSFATIFPDLFFLRLSPMGGSPATIKDPSVSWAAFMPAFREFRYELFEHGNILWSNIRSLGLPMLGNGVQGAPLFPLNLALIWLPDSLYWSVMPITRVILIGLGAYLLCRRIFGLSLIASLCFALLAGFNVNVMRWINHPWQNGLLAGIWYTYFCCTLFIYAKAKRSILFLHWLGLIIAVFGMITNGFPEASALAAILAAMLFIAFILSNWLLIKPNWLISFGLIVVGHVVGLSLSAVQIFALLEFIDVGQALELREGFIGGTYKPDEYIPFLLGQFSIFWAVPEALKYLNFTIGLFGTFFLIRGLCLWLKVSKKPWIGIACLLMMALYIVKSFGLSSAVEWVFAHTPVLAQSHFPLYFSPLFYFGAAYFVALGIESYISAYKTPLNSRILDFGISCAAGLIVLLLCILNIKQFMQMPWFGLIEFLFTEELRHFLFFLVGVTLIVGLQFLCLFSISKKYKLSHQITSPACLSLILIVCFLSEISVTQFDRHERLDHWSLGLSNDLNSTFDDVVNNAPVTRHELRSNDRNGDFAGYGIGLVDNGVSAILPPDQRKIRTGMFEASFAGYFPIDLTRRNWSWESMSSNLVAVSTTPKLNIDWSERHSEPEIGARVLDWQQSVTIARTQPFYLQGKVEGFFETVPNVIPWIHLQGKEHDFWVEGNIRGYEYLEKVGDRQKVVASWRLRIPDEWLLEDEYQMMVRLGKQNREGFADTRPSTLILTPLQENIDKSTRYPDLFNAELVGVSPEQDLHFYFNPDALPRAYIASECESSKTLEETLEFLRASDAVLKGKITVASTNNSTLNCKDYSGDFRRIAIDEDVGSRLDLETISGPALIAINNYHYPGWQAHDELSWESFDILKANGIFRAVYLPEERDYQLQLSYQPDWLKIVYLLLILAMILILSIWWFLGKAQRQN